MVAAAQGLSRTPSGLGCGIPGTRSSGRGRSLSTWHPWGSSCLCSILGPTHQWPIQLVLAPSLGVSSQLFLGGMAWGTERASCLTWLLGAHTGSHPCRQISPGLAQQVGNPADQKPGDKGWGETRKEGRDPSTKRRVREKWDAFPCWYPVAVSLEKSIE